MVQEIPVDVDAVGLAEVCGDEGSDGREEGRLEVGGVAGVDYFRGGDVKGLGGRSAVDGRSERCGHWWLVLGGGGGTRGHVRALTGLFCLFEL